MALKPSATGKRVANELSTTIVDRLDAPRDFNRGCAPKFPARRGSVKTEPAALIDALADAWIRALIHRGGGRGVP